MTPSHPSDGRIYEYLDPAQHKIRILRLLPGSHHDPIKCTLHTAHLSDDPDYEALSYAWGNLNGSRSTIRVDENEVGITLNLEAAIRRLRRETQHRDLWVDALCINQADDKEKSHQVRQMWLVFSKMEQGIVWLGDYVEENDDAGYDSGDTEITTLTRNEVNLAFRLVEFMASGQHAPGNNEDHEDTGKPKMSAEMMAAAAPALHKLMQVAWWQRIWTVQEFILPKQAILVYGTQHISRATMILGCQASLDHFFTRCCGFPDGSLRSYWDKLDSIRCIMRNGKYDDYIFWEALNMFRERGASNPKDRVYALLGLGSDLQPDYTLSLEEVFTGAVRASIETTGSLHSLLRTAEEVRSPEVPRWAPDWCAKLPSATWYSVSMPWYYQFSYYDAAKRTKAKMRTPRDRSELCLQGFIIDRVRAVVPPPWNDGFKAKIAACQALADETSKRHENAYPRGGTYDDAWWRTAVADMMYYGDDTKYLRAKPEDEALCREYLRSELARDLVGSSVQLTGKSFFATETGMLGLCGETVEVGDVVSVLFGGNMPFVLRPRDERADDGTMKYEYVGQAYVHSIMDGEVIEEERDPAWINLC